MYVFHCYNLNSYRMYAESFESNWRMITWTDYHTYRVFTVWLFGEKNVEQADAQIK